MDKPECKDCRYYAENDLLEADESLGFCYRYPPSVKMKSPEQHECFRTQPLVFRFDWCGEFVARRPDRDPPKGRA